MKRIQRQYLTIGLLKLEVFRWCMISKAGSLIIREVSLKVLHID